MSLLDASKTKPLDGGPSFSLGNRVTRAAWNVTWLILARWTPPPLHRWRAFILRLFGAKIAPGARVYGSTKIWLPSNLTLGEQSLIGPGAMIYNQTHITIGKRSIVSQRAHICTGTHDISDPNFQLVLRPVMIGDNCWVAAEAFVGPGVKIADGSVVGGRCAIFHDTEKYGVYRGNPAKRIKQRIIQGD